MESKFYRETKVVRLKVHPRSFSCKLAWKVPLRQINSPFPSAVEDLIVNLDWFSKDKFQLFDENVLEIFHPDDGNVEQRFGNVHACI